MLPFGAAWAHALRLHANQFLPITISQTNLRSWQASQLRAAAFAANHPETPLHTDGAEAVLALGSNMGDRARMMHWAIQQLNGHGIQVLRCSSLYETAPAYVTEQPTFLNAAVLVRTVLTPPSLLTALKALEAQAGRDLGGLRWGPRPLDLDIIFYGSGTYQDGRLEVPHPRWAERSFVVVPVGDLWHDTDARLGSTEAAPPTAACANGSSSSGDSDSNRDDGCSSSGSSRDGSGVSSPAVGMGGSAVVHEGSHHHCRLPVGSSGSVHPWLAAAARLVRASLSPTQNSHAHAVEHPQLMGGHPPPSAGFPPLSSTQPTSRPSPPTAAPQLHHPSTPAAAGMPAAPPMPQLPLPLPSLHASHPKQHTLSPPPMPQQPPPEPDLPCQGCPPAPEAVATPAAAAAVAATVVCGGEVMRRVMPVRRGGRLLSWGVRTRSMGILNVTPDSFSDGGRFMGSAQWHARGCEHPGPACHPSSWNNSTDTNSSSGDSSDPQGRSSAAVDVHLAVQAACDMVAQGADIIDVGGQSTRPGAVAVSLEEELARVLPVIRALTSCSQLGKALVSVDTFRAEVARQAVEAGADLVNDVSGGTLDPNMLPQVAALGVPYVLMHMRGDPSNMASPSLTQYKCVWREVGQEMQAAVDRAVQAGIPAWSILLDPGIGFAKTALGSLSLIRNLASLRLECLQGSARHAPLLVGPSRKRFLASLVGRAPAESDVATAAAAACLVGQGADCIRVHNVGMVRDALLVADALHRQ